MRGAFFRYLLASPGVKRPSPDVEKLTKVTSVLKTICLWVDPYFSFIRLAHVFRSTRLLLVIAEMVEPDDETSEPARIGLAIQQPSNLV